MIEFKYLSCATLEHAENLYLRRFGPGPETGHLSESAGPQVPKRERICPASTPQGNGAREGVTMKTAVEELRKARLVWPKIIDRAFLERYIQDGTISPKEAEEVLSG